MLAKTDANFRKSRMPAIAHIRPKIEKLSIRRSTPNPARVRPRNMSSPLLIIIMRLKNFRWSRASVFDELRELIMSRLMPWSSTSRFKSARRSGEGEACSILSFSLTWRTSQALGIGRGPFYGARSGGGRLRRQLRLRLLHLRLGQ